MEGVVVMSHSHAVTIDPGFWKNRRVFITGHTGFKGSWMTLWLQMMGADVHGYALPPPTTTNLFDVANIGQDIRSTIGDVRDLDHLQAAMQGHRPEIVFHLAAQPLVRLSYHEPVRTMGTNVMGTVHLLEAVRRLDSVRVVVNVTTDKCYENREWIYAYREGERLGGHDPYSASKACAEMVSSAYQRSFLGAADVRLATARAGNVIGGGDWAADRLVPDIFRAFEQRHPVAIRHPNATRPWQHVLEPLCGYLVLAQRLHANDGRDFTGAWNFGPREEDARPVHWIVEHLADRWGDGACSVLDVQPRQHEAHHLRLDITKAKSLLGWRPAWDLCQALDATVRWHRHWLNGGDVAAFCRRQIREYLASLTDRDPGPRALPVVESHMEPA